MASSSRARPSVTRLGAKPGPAPGAAGRRRPGRRRRGPGRNHATAAAAWTAAWSTGPWCRCSSARPHSSQPLLQAVRVPLDVPEAAAQPADGDRRLAQVEVLVEQPGGRPGRAPVVAGPPEGGVGPVAGAAIDSPVRHCHQAASARASSSGPVPCSTANLPERHALLYIPGVDSVSVRVGFGEHGRRRPRRPCRISQIDASDFSSLKGTVEAKSNEELGQRHPAAGGRRRRRPRQGVRRACRNRSTLAQGGRPAGGRRVP